MAGEPPLLRVKNAVIEPLPQAVRSWLVRIVALLVFVAVWWLVSGLRLIDATFLPTPKAVWDAAVRASTWHQVAPGVPREVLGDTVRDPSVTGTPEFQVLRTELAAAIYAAHG